MKQFLLKIYRTLCGMVTFYVKRRDQSLQYLLLIPLLPDKQTFIFYFILE